MLKVVSDVLTAEDLVTVSVAKCSDAKYAKIHIFKKDLSLGAISKQIDFE